MIVLGGGLVFATMIVLGTVSADLENRLDSAAGGLFAALLIGGLVAAQEFRTTP